MEEVGAAVQIVQISADVIFKTIGLSADMIEMLVNAVQYVRQQDLIKGGETSFEKLAKKDGTIEVFQFPTESRSQIYEALNKYHVSYTPAMDLNAGDGMSEIFISGSDINRVNVICEKMGIGRVMGVDEYLNNADPEMAEFLQDHEADPTVPESVTVDESIQTDDKTFIRTAIPMENVIYLEDYRNNNTGTDNIVLLQEKGEAVANVASSRAKKTSETGKESSLESGTTEKPVDKQNENGMAVQRPAKTPAIPRSREIEFSINERTIYAGVQDGSYRVRIPGTHNYVCIPQKYSRSVKTDKDQTLLIKVPVNIRCKVTDESGKLVREMSALEVHNLGFSKSDRLDKAFKYRKEKEQKRLEGSLSQRRRGKKQMRY